MKNANSSLLKLRQSDNVAATDSRPIAIKDFSLLFRRQKRHKGKNRDLQNQNMTLFSTLILHFASHTFYQAIYKQQSCCIITPSPGR
jgi:hypothetical protein